MKAAAWPLYPQPSSNPLITLTIKFPDLYAQLIINMKVEEGMDGRGLYEQIKSLTRCDDGDLTTSWFHE